ncbi:hypothetical protein GGX14DRAFT_556042 [Mycena pura]|uniref:Uncharacterized protein n=1 Tax=Mycena pura TaxID=153505 RepID=A0AAD7E4X7_9AGAR|nr:hypothetical protein GGX14DRAFT_556042 [Mycena pura]
MPSGDKSAAIAAGKPKVIGAVPEGFKKCTGTRFPHHIRPQKKSEERPKKKQKVAGHDADSDVDSDASDEELETSYTTRSPRSRRRHCGSPSVCAPFRYASALGSRRGGLCARCVARKCGRGCGCGATRAGKTAMCAAGVAAGTQAGARMGGGTYGCAAASGAQLRRPGVDVYAYADESAADGRYAPVPIWMDLPRCHAVHATRARCIPEPYTSACNILLSYAAIGPRVNVPPGKTALGSGSVLLLVLVLAHVRERRTWRQAPEPPRSVWCCSACARVGDVENTDPRPVVSCGTSSCVEELVMRLCESEQRVALKRAVTAPSHF